MEESLEVTWPAWGDILPTVSLVVGLGGALTGVCWALMRLFRPVAEKAAHDATDRLYDRLAGNDFRHVEDGLKDLGDRISRVREDFGGRIDRMGERLDSLRSDFGGRLDRVDARLNRVDDRLDRVDDRLDRVDDRLDGVRVELGERIDGARVEFGERIDGVRAELGERIDGVRAELGERIDRARQDRMEMEARLMAAILGRSGPE